MTTVWRIARREWTDWSRDRWRVWAAAGLALVALAAAVTGAMAADARASEARRAQQADYDRWLTQPPRRPHDASHFGISAFYVPSAFSAVDPGVGAYAGSALFLEAHKQNEPVFSEAVDRGGAARLGDLSLSTVIQIWLPLIVVLLGAGTLSADREAGILAQLMATGPSPRQIAGGKALAVALAAALLIAPSVFAVGVLVTRSAGAWPADAGTRIAALAAAAFAYLVFWVALTLAVSARARSWRTAVASLVAVWCLSVVIAPRLATDVARTRHPLPSRAELDRLELESRIGSPSSGEKARQKILDEFGVKTADQLPVDIAVIIGQRAEAGINARLDVRNQLYTDAYQAERRDYLRAAWFTPAVAIDVALAGAAGSDDVHHRAFLGRAELYRRRMMDMLGEADTRKPGEKATRVDGTVWSRLPILQPAVPVLRDAESRVGAALLGLAGWSVAALVLASTAVRRLRARA